MASHRVCAKKLRRIVVECGFMEFLAGDVSLESPAFLLAFQKMAARG
jgi:hypothetical protein